MRQKLIQAIPLLIVCIGVGFTYISYDCIYSGSWCYTSWVNYIYEYFTQPLYFFSLYSLPLAIVLIFIRRDVFNSWLKFAVWALPLSIFFIATTPFSSSALISFVRDDAAQLYSLVLSVISFALLGTKMLHAHRYAQHRLTLDAKEAENIVTDTEIVWYARAGLLLLLASVASLFFTSLDDVWWLISSLLALFAIGYVCVEIGVLYIRARRSGIHLRSLTRKAVGWLTVDLFALCALYALYVSANLGWWA